jgi:hypothetical protein
VWCKHKYGSTYKWGRTSWQVLQIKGDAGDVKALRVAHKVFQERTAEFRQVRAHLHACMHAGHQEHGSVMNKSFNSCTIKRPPAFSAHAQLQYRHWQTCQDAKRDYASRKYDPKDVITSSWSAHARHTPASNAWACCKNEVFLQATGQCPCKSNNVPSRTASRCTAACS